MMIAKLKELFCPESVAVVGASNSFDKLGYHIVKSLVQGDYGGRIFPVNPTGQEIWGIRSYPALSDVPETVDLAVIAVPARFIPEILHECGRKMVKESRAAGPCQGTARIPASYIHAFLPDCSHERASILIRSIQVRQGIYNRARPIDNIEAYIRQAVAFLPAVGHRF